MQFTKFYIKFYAIFMIIAVLLQLSGVPILLPTVPTITVFNIGNILVWVGNFISWLVAIVLYTIPNQFVINTLLWSFRIIVFIEMGKYLTERFNDIVPL